MLKKNAETRTSIRRTPIPVIVRSVMLTGKASGKHFRKKPWPILGLVSPMGLSLQGFILSRAACVCVCIHLYYIRCISQKKANDFFPRLFFPPSCLPPESLSCVFPKAQEKESTECNDDSDNKRRLSTQQRDDKLVDTVK